MLNNREIAILVWAPLLLALALSRTGVRPASKAVVRAFFNRYFVTACTLMVAYVALVVYMLSLAGLWQLRQLEDTLIWLIVVAFASFFRLAEKADDPIYFKDALKDNLKIIVIVEFIIAFYPASLLVELILVPFAPCWVFSSSSPNGSPRVILATRLPGGSVNVYHLRD